MKTPYHVRWLVTGYFFYKVIKLIIIFNQIQKIAMCAKAYVNALYVVVFFFHSWYL